MNRSRRIAMYVHSLNPRGGVVHALSVAEALQKLGHCVTLVAPARKNERLFRETSVRTRFFSASAPRGSLSQMVRNRVEEYIDFTRVELTDLDLYHAHDGMTGFALARLRETGEIPAFARTVHHLDEFSDSFLTSAQARSIAEADTLFCVSQTWAQRVESQYARPVTMVGNGVDRERFSPEALPDDAAICRSIVGDRAGPMILCVGGVESRKNTLTSLAAYLSVQPRLAAGSTLVVAGGASILDHSEYRRAFDEKLATASDPASIKITGPVTDKVMAALYRSASLLLFPSVIEGFGLAVLEAMASGTPVVTSRIAPFIEYLADADAMLVNPTDIESVSDGILSASNPSRRMELARQGLEITTRFTWAACALKYESAYQRLSDRQGDSHAGNAVRGSVAG